MTRDIVEKINKLLENELITEEEAKELIDSIDVNSEFDEERKELSKEAIKDIFEKPYVRKGQRTREVIKKVETTVKLTTKEAGEALRKGGEELGKSVLYLGKEVSKGVNKLTDELKNIKAGMNTTVENKDITHTLDSTNEISIECEDVSSMSIDYSRKNRTTFKLSQNKIEVKQVDGKDFKLNIDTENIAVPLVIEKVAGVLKLRIVNSNELIKQLNENVKLTITMPKHFNELNFKVLSNDVNFSNEVNVEKIDISAATGKIDFETINCETLKINSVSGSVTGKEFNGNLKLKTVSSDLTLRKCTGNCKVNLVSGNVLIKEMNGDAKIKTVNGDVAVINLKLDDLMEVNSVSGNIIVTPAKDKKYNYKLQSNIGNVRCVYLDNLVKKTDKTFLSEVEGDTYPTVKCNTASGWVSVE